ncbi:helix-turn-helix domain-containing protein [Vallitalea sediminicola]
MQDYTTSLKIEKAKDLLVSTKMTINQIAEEVGYNNVTSFIRRFKQLIGTTPGRYRKDYKD